jgi:hypothetical protein
VEDGPWPQNDASWREHLKLLQDKILDAIDAAVDGGLAKVFPESAGKSVRVQVDSPAGCPEKVQSLVDAVEKYISTASEYVRATENSPFVAGIRVVTGKSMGRFGGK